MCLIYLGTKLGNNNKKKNNVKENMTYSSHKASVWQQTVQYALF